MSMANSDSQSLPQVLAWEDFIKLTGISAENLDEIIALGWLTTQPIANQRDSFLESDIYRVRKLKRICGDFELPVIGGAIIVDLLDRLDRLELLARRFNELDQ